MCRNQRLFIRCYRTRWRLQRVLMKNLQFSLGLDAPCKHSTAQWDSHITTAKNSPKACPIASVKLCTKRICGSVQSSKLQVCQIIVAIKTASMQKSQINSTALCYSLWHVRWPQDWGLKRWIWWIKACCTWLKCKQGWWQDNKQTRAFCKVLGKTGCAFPWAPCSLFITFIFMNSVTMLAIKE